MQRIQPRTLTNDELERLIYITGIDRVPSSWITAFIATSNTYLNTEPPKDPAQLELDLS